MSVMAVKQAMRSKARSRQGVSEVGEHSRPPRPGSSRSPRLPLLSFVGVGRPPVKSPAPLDVSLPSRGAFPFAAARFCGPGGESAVPLRS